MWGEGEVDWERHDGREDYGSLMIFGGLYLKLASGKVVIAEIRKTFYLVAQLLSLSSSK